MRFPSFSVWRGACVILGCSLVLLVVIFWETAASTVAIWSQDPFAHGYLVGPVSLYLAWTGRVDLRSLSPRPAFWALLLLSLLAFLWLLGSLTNTAIVQQLCLVAMFFGFVWGALGSSAARSLIFPLAFLLFALPLGSRLIPTLQDFAAGFAATMLERSGVPVLLEGRVISIPGSRWQVADACSGINYLMSSLAVGYLFAGTAYRYWVHRTGFFLASFVFPLVANGLRVYTTILIAYFGGTRIAAGMEHYLYGWLVFTLTMGLMFAVCGRWREEPPETVMRPLKSAGSLAVATSLRGTALFATLGLLVVGIAPLSARSFWPQSGAEESIPPISWEVSLPWKVSGRDVYRWTPRFVTPSTESIQTYASGEQVVTFYVAYYGAYQPGVDLASSANQLFDDPWWASSEGHASVTVDGHPFQADETFLRSPQASLVVWNWYWVDGTFTGSDYVAKLLLAKARLFRSRQGSAAMVVATEDRPGVEATSILQDFLRHVSLPENRR